MRRATSWPASQRAAPRSLLSLSASRTGQNHSAYRTYRPCQGAPPVIHPACARLILRKLRLDRRPSVVRKPEFTRHLTHPVRKGRVNHGYQTISIRWLSFDPRALSGFRGQVYRISSACPVAK